MEKWPSTEHLKDWKYFYPSAQGTEDNVWWNHSVQQKETEITRRTFASPKNHGIVIPFWVFCTYFPLMCDYSPLTESYRACITGCFNEEQLSS